MQAKVVQNCITGAGKQGKLQQQNKMHSRQQEAAGYNAAAQAANQSQQKTCKLAKHSNIE